MQINTQPTCHGNHERNISDILQKFLEHFLEKIHRCKIKQILIYMQHILLKIGSLWNYNFIKLYFYEKSDSPV